MTFMSNCCASRCRRLTGRRARSAPASTSGPTTRTRTAGRTGSARSPDDASIGDLPEMRALLAAAKRAGNDPLAAGARVLGDRVQLGYEARPTRRACRRRCTRAGLPRRSIECGRQGSARSSGSGCRTTRSASPPISPASSPQADGPSRRSRPSGSRSSPSGHRAASRSGAGRHSASAAP